MILGRYAVGEFLCADTGDASASVHFANLAYASVYCLGIAVLCSSIMLISVKFMDDNREFTRWWKFARFGIATTTTFLIVGTVLLFRMFHIMMEIKFPNACESWHPCTMRCVEACSTPVLHIDQKFFWVKCRAGGTVRQRQPPWFNRSQWR